MIRKLEKQFINTKSPSKNTENTCERKSIPGSTSFVPSVAGLIIASEVIKDITNVRNDIPVV